MQWEFILALVITIPLILFPVALIWYFNVGGIYEAIKRARIRQAQVNRKENVRIEVK